jgi:TctA family transporter
VATTFDGYPMARDGKATQALVFAFLLMVAGVLFGLLVGVLPGLGAPNGVSLLLPLTFAMDPVAAIILLTSTTGAR